MPILICLKEPTINLIVEGEIKDESEKEWDKIFREGVLLVKKKNGRNLLVPIWRESNIAFMQEVTEEDIEKGKEEFEKRQKGSVIERPSYSFPGGRLRR